MTWQNPGPLGFAASRVEELIVAQELINKVKLKCCGILVNIKIEKLPVSTKGTDSFLLWNQTDYNMADDDMWIVSRKANPGFKYIYTIKFGGDEDPLPRFCSLVRENLLPH